GGEAQFPHQANVKTGSRIRCRCVRARPSHKMLPRRSSVFFSTAAKQDTNYICFAGSSFYANSKTNGKVNTNRESGPIKSDVEARVKVRVRNQKPCPHIAFAKAIAHADHLGVNHHVDTFTKQICEVNVIMTQAVKPEDS